VPVLLLTIVLSSLYIQTSQLDMLRCVHRELPFVVRGPRFNFCPLKQHFSLARHGPHCRRSSVTTAFMSISSRKQEVIQSNLGPPVNSYVVLALQAPSTTFRGLNRPIFLHTYKCDKFVATNTLEQIFNVSQLVLAFIQLKTLPPASSLPLPSPYSLVCVACAWLLFQWPHTWLPNLHSRHLDPDPCGPSPSPFRVSGVSCTLCISFDLLPGGHLPCALSSLWWVVFLPCTQRLGLSLRGTLCDLIRLFPRTVCSRAHTVKPPLPSSLCLHWLRYLDAQGPLTMSVLLGPLADQVVQLGEPALGRVYQEGSLGAQQCPMP
jgi:hypothetical protein